MDYSAAPQCDANGDCSYKKMSHRRGPPQPVVDEIEDTKSREFQTVQQLSTPCRHLIETKHVENRTLRGKPETALVRRCAPAGAPLDSTT